MCNLGHRHYFFFLFILLLLPFISQAHVTNYAMEKLPADQVFFYYIKLGFTHIIPYGADHILFISALCFLDPRLKTIIMQATVFTIAHSLTLLLGFKNILQFHSAVIEPIIALSIVFIAIENILIKELKPWRLLIVLFFGLVHGLGFASALQETGLPRNHFLTSLLAFNLGVELGQIGVVLLVYFLIIRSTKSRTWYTRGVVYPVSVLIALIACYWAIERMIL